MDDDTVDTDPNPAQPQAERSKMQQRGDIVYLMASSSLPRCHTS